MRGCTDRRRRVSFLVLLVLLAASVVFALCFPHLVRLEDDNISPEQPQVGDSGTRGGSAQQGGVPPPGGPKRPDFAPRRGGRARPDGSHSPPGTGTPSSSTPRGARARPVPGARRGGAASSPRAQAAPGGASSASLSGPSPPGTRAQPRPPRPGARAPPVSGGVPSPGTLAPLPPPPPVGVPPGARARPEAGACTPPRGPSPPGARTPPADGASPAARAPPSGGSPSPPGSATPPPTSTRPGSAPPPPQGKAKNATASPPPPDRQTEEKNAANTVLIIGCIYSLFCFCGPIITYWSTRSREATNAFHGWLDLLTSALGCCAWLLFGIAQIHTEGGRVVGIAAIVVNSFGVAIYATYMVVKLANKGYFRTRTCAGVISGFIALFTLIIICAVLTPIKKDSGRAIGLSIFACVIQLLSQGISLLNVFPLIWLMIHPPATEQRSPHINTRKLTVFSTMNNFAVYLIWASYCIMRFEQDYFALANVIGAAMALVNMFLNLLHALRPHTLLLKHQLNKLSEV